MICDLEPECGCGENEQPCYRKALLERQKMYRELWYTLWQLQIAITCECIYRRYWDSKGHDDPFWEIYEFRNTVTTKPIFQLQVRDRLFWDETFRNQKEMKNE